MFPYASATTIANIIIIIIIIITNNIIVINTNITITVNINITIINNINTTTITTTDTTTITNITTTTTSTDGQFYQRVHKPSYTHEQQQQCTAVPTLNSRFLLRTKRPGEGSVARNSAPEAPQDCSQTWLPWPCIPSQ